MQWRIQRRRRPEKTGDGITLEEFVAEIEELVRLALRKAVEAVGAGKRWPPDWDALALEGATYPSK